MFMHTSKTLIRLGMCAQADPNLCLRRKSLILLCFWPVSSIKYKLACEDSNQSALIHVARSES